LKCFDTQDELDMLQKRFVQRGYYVTNLVSKQFDFYVVEETTLLNFAKVRKPEKFDVMYITRRHVGKSFKVVRDGFSTLS